MLPALSTGIPTFLQNKEERTLINRLFKSLTQRALAYFVYWTYFDSPRRQKCLAAEKLPIGN